MFEKSEGFTLRTFALLPRHCVLVYIGVEYIPKARYFVLKAFLWVKKRGYLERCLFFATFAQILAACAE